MPWRHLIFSAEHGIVFPAPPTLQTAAKKQQDLELLDLQLLESMETTPKKQQHLELPASMEKLGMSDTASSATTSSQSRRGSASPMSIAKRAIMEKLGMSDIASAATTPSQSRSGSRSPISVAKRATPIPA